MAASPSTLISSLPAAQNEDGGWGYREGSSWTEPTVYALLALAVEHPKSSCIRNGMDWVMRARRWDGGWPPTPRVSQSTWVTALVVLLMAEFGVLRRDDPAIGWLLRQTGRESGAIFRLRRWLLGVRSDYDREHAGWPWFPEAAAWVAPTALTLLALNKARTRLGTERFDSRIEEGRKFLMSRVCSDGGWNHGSARALGYEAQSYPEMTGLGLLALHGLDSPFVKRAIQSARTHLETAHSSQAISWLRMGLHAHRIEMGVRPAACRNILDISLRCLEYSATTRRNPLLIASQYGNENKVGQALGLGRPLRPPSPFFKGAVE